jgi:hypothetical protein
MPPASDSQRATIPPATGDPPRAPSSNSYRDLPLVITALLLALRLVNALTIRTFFQPDEFFQSLEPAWQLAFGRGADAWITWVNPSFCHQVSSDPALVPVKSCLTNHPGVENPIAVLSAPSTVCSSLSAGGKNFYLLWRELV